MNDGLEADVMTMNTTTDIDFLAGTGVVAKDWAKRFPGNASPTSSAMLFLVRNGTLQFHNRSVVNVASY